MISSESSVIANTKIQSHKQVAKWTFKLEPETSMSTPAVPKRRKRTPKKSSPVVKKDSTSSSIRSRISNIAKKKSNRR